MWRWAAGVWAALVMAGGGLTLWLQDANEPDPPAGWEEAPGPRLSADVDQTSCPTRASQAGPVRVLCVYSTR